MINTHSTCVTHSTYVTPLLVRTLSTSINVCEFKIFDKRSSFVLLCTKLVLLSFASIIIRLSLSA